MDEGEQKPTVVESIAGLLIMSGFAVVIASIPLAFVVAVPPHPDGLPWTWTATAVVGLTAVFIAFGLLLIYAAAALCWWKWGHWPNVFWGSRKKQSDSPNGQAAPPA
jgi:hypothetical protein